MDNGRNETSRAEQISTRYVNMSALKNGSFNRESSEISSSEDDLRLRIQDAKSGASRKPQPKSKSEDSPKAGIPQDASFEEQKGNDTPSEAAEIETQASKEPTIDRFCRGVFPVGDETMSDTEQTETEDEEAMDSPTTTQQDISNEDLDEPLKGTNVTSDQVRKVNTADVSTSELKKIFFFCVSCTRIVLVAYEHPCPFKIIRNSFYEEPKHACVLTHCRQCVKEIMPFKFRDASVVEVQKKLDDAFELLRHSPAIFSEFQAHATMETMVGGRVETEVSGGGKLLYETIEKIWDQVTEKCQMSGVSWKDANSPAGKLPYLPGGFF